MLDTGWVLKPVLGFMGLTTVYPVQGPKAVLGPGTGLGQAQVLWDEGLGGYRVWPSEGSHATFAPRGWKQRALQVLACCLVQGAQQVQGGIDDPAGFSCDYGVRLEALRTCRTSPHA